MTLTTETDKPADATRVVARNLKKREELKHFISTPAETDPEKRSGFQIWQETHERESVNGRVSWKIKHCVRLVWASGNRDECVAAIEVAQERFRSSGFNAEGNYWWAHDRTEGYGAPKMVYRWFLE